MGALGRGRRLAACTTGSGSSASPSSAASAAAPSLAPSDAPSEEPVPSYATEGELFMYNWSDYISPDNIDAFKARYGDQHVPVRHLRRQRRRSWPRSRVAAAATTSPRRRRNTSSGWPRKASSRSSTCLGSRTSSTSTRPSRRSGGIPMTSTRFRRTSAPPASCTAATCSRRFPRHGGSSTRCSRPRHRRRSSS